MHLSHRPESPAPELVLAALAVTVDGRLIWSESAPFENHRKGVWRARVPLTVGSLCRSDGTAAYGRSPPRESLGSSTAATALEASPANLCANNLYEWPRRARSIGRKGELAAERARDAEALAKLAAKPNVTMPSQWRDRLPTARRRLIER